VATHLDEDAVEAEDAASRLRAAGTREDRRFLNRELSWLDFNARVLALAEDEDQPLLERAKFLAIFAENLDEFFQVRVAGLKDQLAAGLGAPRGEGDSPADQLQAIRVQTEGLIDRQVQVFMKSLAPALGENGVVFSEWDALDDDDRSYLVDVFEKSIYPVLTPLAVDPGHPFPYISNLSLNLAVIVSDPTSGERRFARVKVPPLLSRFVVMPDGERFVPLEQVIAAHLHLLFPGMQVESVNAFRVTRNADLSLEEEDADDLLAAVELELRRRRFGRAVRLEVDVDTSAEVCELLLRELDLGPDDIYKVEGPLDLGGLWAVYELPRPELKDEAWVGITQARLSAIGDDDGPDIFSVMREGELLVHHPYDSFATSVEVLIEQAAVDPQVLAIKQTVYRTSGDSPIVRALIKAADLGKQVVALVELKARFDEQANIEWAKALEQAGVHVVYGLVGLKTHTKTALVVREEEGLVRRYCHVGTGNYNSKTARLYEDIGLLSCDPALGEDLTELFNYLTGYSRKVDYRKLLVAPLKLRDEILRLIGEQTSADGRIVMKMNNLVDQEVIDTLYAASQAGAEIDLIVRSVCCLRPGVPGLSENITVRSIVGRYLEHSRIYGFGKRRRRKYYIGSADLMPRNLDRRVEALAPVTDEVLIDRLQGILDINREDDTLAWELRPDGVWTKVPTVEGVNTHRRLQELALERTRRRRDTSTEA
jgi:polyphosphate kinase